MSKAKKAAGVRGKKKTTLPEALAKRATTAHEGRMERLAVKGRNALGLIAATRKAVATNYFSMGEALAVLKTPGMAEALGRTDFADICENDLKMAEATANELVGLVKRLTRATVELLGRERSNAMLALVDATPAEDTVEEVLTRTLRLPSGKPLVVRDASTATLYAAAKEYRQARALAPGKRSEGFTTSTDERARYAKAEKHWQRKDVKTLVETRLVASRRGHGAIVRAEMPLSIWERLRPPTAPG
jgi:hypothetical protein